MAFCENCGFLLPADFKSKVILCNPCKRSCNPRSKPCDCELCTHSFSTQKREEQSNLSGIQIHHSSNSEWETNEPTRNAQNKTLFDDDVNFDGNDFSSSDSTDSSDYEDEEECGVSQNENVNFEVSNQNNFMTSRIDLEPLFARTSDLKIDKDFIASAKENVRDWTAIDTNEDDWTVVKKSRQTKSPSQDLGVVRKDDQVSEDIREQWTQEQARYLKRLITEDTPTIERLISGNRRKCDDSYFYIGGVDISFIKNNNVDACASLTVLRMPSLKLVYQRMEMIKLTQPYIPGFLAFREVPPLLTLFEHLKKTAPHFMPDVVMVDGNGILHPRGFGLACQLGVMLGIPTIGVAKSLMSAQGLEDDAEHKKKKQTLQEGGHGFDLVSKETDAILGRCLRVHDDAPNPIYVSIGHQISLSSAEWIVLETSKYRIPEPVRMADLDSREYIRQNKKQPQEFIWDGGL